MIFATQIGHMGLPLAEPLPAVKRRVYVGEPLIYVRDGTVRRGIKHDSLAWNSGSQVSHCTSASAQHSKTVRMNKQICTQPLSSL